MALQETMGPTPTLDELDLAIIRASQAGLPITRRPYDELAKVVGTTPDLVQARMSVMLQAGIIRRIGVVPNHYALGFRANGMTVWDVADEKVQELGEQVGALDFVSHAYHRPRHLPEWPFNLFAMVHGSSKEGVRDHITHIARLLGDHCRKSDVLYSTKILKKTGLRLPGLTKED
jgi:DNA-binding Lrp family transcriptional regulator